VQVTKYVKSEGVSLAYRVTGDAGPTLLHVPGALGNLAMQEQSASSLRDLERMSRFCRLVRFDKRATGLSDWSAAPPTLSQQVPDVDAVRQVVGAEQVALSGLSQGAAVAILYALRFPERVTHLILVDGVCCDARDPYLPMSDTNTLEDWSRFFGLMQDDFDAFSRWFASRCFPGTADSFQEAVAEGLKATANPSAFEALWRGVVGVDLRPQLGRISCPVLVLHARGDQHHPVAHGRYLAEHIPGARYVELDTLFHVPGLDPAISDQIPAAIEEFLTGSVRHTAERRFASVLFTDIVDSTAQQRERGDRAWRGVLEAHEATTRRLVEQFGGRVVEVEGDGLMAEFPAAGESLRAARAIANAAREQGVRIRAGLHAGEVYEAGGRLFGICINIAARVAAQAGADEVLTTELVAGLVEGSDLTLTSHGEFDLKGVGVRRLVRLA
jgi:pimeloyl-ACP methyl ester carboxylesterase/class 3 adenylate cyclase